MSCILIERDVNRYDDFDKETRAYKTVRTVHEQHVVDLDKAIFTCNWRYGLRWDENEGIQDHFIRGIVVPDGKTQIFGKVLPLHGSSCEIPVKDLPAKEREKIYGMYDDRTLDDVWRMIQDTYENYPIHQWLSPEKYYSVRNKYLLDRKCPLMIVEHVSACSANDFTGYDAPVIIQPGAISCGTFCDWKLKLSTPYGKLNLDRSAWRGEFCRYADFYFKAARLDRVFALSASAKETK